MVVFVPSGRFGYSEISVTLMLMLFVVTGAAAQSDDDSLDFGPSDPVEVTNIRWDITAYHPDYHPFKRNRILYLRFYAPLRFARGASINDVQSAKLVDWDDKSWTFHMSEKWDSWNQQIFNNGLYDTMLSPESRAMTVGPLEFQLNLAGSRTISTPVSMTPPGSDHLSALIVYAPDYAGDVGPMHVQMLSYAEIHEVRKNRDEISVVFSVDDGRVYTGMIVLIDSDDKQIYLSRYFRAWDGDRIISEMNGGSAFYTDGTVNRVVLSGLTEAQWNDAAYAAVLLFDGPETYHYRSFSATEVIKPGSAP